MFDIFLIFAQNIDCGYMLEPPRRGGSNEYPQSIIKPPFFYIKERFKGCSFHEHVFLMKRQSKLSKYSGEA